MDCKLVNIIVSIGLVFCAVGAIIMSFNINALNQDLDRLDHRLIRVETTNTTIPPTYCDFD